VTSGASQTAGVPARATLGVGSRQDWPQISAQAHRNFESARWSHPTKNSPAVRGDSRCPMTSRGRSGFGRQVEAFEDAVAGVHSVQHVEVNSRHAFVDQVLTLLDGEFDSDFELRLLVILRCFQL